MKRARAPIAAPAADREAAVVTAAAVAVVMAGGVVEAAIATAIVAPAATTANQGGNLVSTACGSGRSISASEARPSGRASGKKKARVRGRACVHFNSAFLFGVRRQSEAATPFWIKSDKLQFVADSGTKR